MSTKPVPEQSGPVEPATATPAAQDAPEQPPAEQPPTAAVESPFAEPDTPAAPGLDDLVARARHEYGRYVALQPIPWQGAPAFATGATVPRSHPGVAQWVADGMVRDLDTDPA